MPVIIKSNAESNGALKIDVVSSLLDNFNKKPWKLVHFWLGLSKLVQFWCF